MTEVAITGFASLDHVLALHGSPTPDATTIARCGAWPRLGGSPSYVALALGSGDGLRAIPVSWIGDDAAGADYLAAMHGAGLAVEGIERIAGGATPKTVMAYTPDGDCYCLHDPGCSTDARLSEAQRAVVARADWVCVTIGPAQAGADVLRSMRPDAHLVWVVKNDAASLQPALMRALAERARVISHSAQEAAFVEGVLGEVPRRDDCLVVQTLGARGAVASWRGHGHAVSTQILDCRDPTGAGDSFVGGLVAALVRRPDDVAAALGAGIAAAYRLLESRERPAASRGVFPPKS
ncbi:MAG: hypothetical protein KGL43_26165 [Burkholderiales bacterium]|nr:hypothetical protein [Burkholderiales bacterium]